MLGGVDRRELVYRATSVAALLVLWHIASVMAASEFFPGPVAVGAALATILTVPDNFRHLAITFMRVYESLFFAMVIGVVLGIIPSFSRIARQFITTTVHPILQAFPTISWVFLALIWFGLSRWSPRFILVLVLLSVVMVNMFEGMKELDASLLELGASFTDSRWRMFSMMYFPQLYPYIFASLRRAHALAWRVIPVAEIFVSTNGIGKQIMLASSRYAVATILAWTFVIVAIVIVFEYGVFGYIDRNTMRRWRNDE